MTIARVALPGKTRRCPHCRSEILDSASVCPKCRHHLRFGGQAGDRVQPTFSPLKVEGTIKHPAIADAWEYQVVLSIRNERGEEITRQVVGVGALQATEERTFALSVDIFATNRGKSP